MPASVIEDWVEVPFRVLKEQDGMRLDNYLVQRLNKYSRARVQELIDSGRVFRTKRSVKASSRIEYGETIIIRYPKTAEPPVPHSFMPILYKDESIVVINKPGGTLSHPTDKILHNTVTTILEKQLGRKVHLAHRLDRETSGALVLALNPLAAKQIYEQFFAHQIQKVYLAVVLGAIPWKRKEVDVPIGPEGGEIRVRQKAGVGQPAITIFDRLRVENNMSLVAASPRTGRLHQIRAHLSYLGFPIVGDKLYNGNGEVYMKAVNKELQSDDLLTLGADRQLLHAWKLTFVSPGTNKKLTIEAPVPADFPLKPEAGS